MNTEQIIAAAKRTIELQSQSIAGLNDLMTDDFVNTVRCLVETKGRLVISGIGKSAIVAQKIVATFNSTGTPALFMHAADAIHGDLGMIQEADVVMVISKSGDSPEIKVLLPLLRGFGNKIIALTGNIHSFLAQHADFVLNSFVLQEACPNNLAPTTSTTAQMVMGDALAVCLMEQKGFGSVDFAKFHPGGNLGKKLYLKVSDIVAQNIPDALKADAGLKEVIVSITQNRLGAVAIVDDNSQILGIVTDGDLRRMMEKTDSFQGLTATDIMTRNPKTIETESLASEAFECMRQYNINQLLVLDQQQYAGIIHLQDLIREGIFN